MPSVCTSKNTSRLYARAAHICVMVLAGLLGASAALAQAGGGQSSTPSLPAGVSAPTAGQVTSSSFQGSVPQGEANDQIIDLTLDDAIQRGLRNNLGVILSGTQTATAKAQRMSQLQNLLPDVEGSIKEADLQVDLAAEGLRIPGIPTIIGPFGYTDIRASLSWSLVNVKSLREYLASKHQFQGGRAERAGCAGSGDSDGGERVSTGGGGRDARGSRGCAGEDGEGFAGPGGGESPGRDGSAAG